MGRGVSADAPTDKTTPVGDAPDHGRPSTRGQGGGGRSVSCPRGVPGKASAQPPIQEGDLPSGSTPSVPPHHQHLKEPSLSGEVGQGPPSRIPRGWQQIFAAVDGGRTLSISSGSTTGSVLPPLWRQNGRGLRSGSLTTSSSIRGKPWPSRRPVQWTLWPMSRTSSIRPPASI